MTQESSRPIEVPLTVVELFQSQGCSSCPPSNSNVLRLIDDPNILVLTYNVTYWDRLGWKDTFGKSSFDQRQWEYARKMQRKNVFTPQVIINGEFDGVGSNPRDLQSLISKGKSSNPRQSVEIFPTAHGNGVIIRGPEHEHGVVNLVRYDNAHVEVPVRRGENSGESLGHNHVVKEVTQIGNWTGGAQEFKFSFSKLDGLKIAILVQRGQAGPVLGAGNL